MRDKLTLKIEIAKDKAIEEFVARINPSMPRARLIYLTRELLEKVDKIREGNIHI